MKHFFVINPHSFNTVKNIKNIQDEIENCFSSKQKTEYTIYFSRRPRDSIAVVHRYMLSISDDEIVRIYAVGGDGILFDCLNGMVNFPNAELTSIPYGNANDVVRAFGQDAIPMFRNIKNLINAPSRPMDIIHYGANYALNEANVGIVGLTMCYANQILRKKISQWKRRFVHNIYTYSALKSIFNKEVRNQYYKIKLDGNDFSGNYSNIHIANCSCSGGNMIPSPYAVPNDGQLEVIFVCANKINDLLTTIGDYQKGRFEKHVVFRHAQCTALEIESDKPLRLQLDGEGFFAHELKLRIIPGGIKFVAPEGMEFMDYSFMAYKKRVKNEKRS